MGTAARNLVLLPAMLIVISLLFFNIFDRYALQGALGIVWVEELCVIIMIWLVFLSGFAVAQDDLHIKVQTLNLPPQAREILEDVTVTLFVGFLVWQTWMLLPRMFSKYAALGWSIKIGYYAIIAGGFLTITVKIAKIFD